MGIPRLFKLPKYNEFNYIPRYYDPEKEAREERMKKIKQEAGVSDEKEYVPMMKGSFRRFHRTAKRDNKVSNIRLLVILILLFLASYYLIFY
jgi:hypothetical protein